MRLIEKFASFTITPNAKVSEAMELIEENHMRSLIVCNKSMMLLGSLSDGDIRRHIIRANNSRGCVSDIYNTSCISLVDDTISDIKYEASKVFDLHPSIMLLPVCTKQNILKLIISKI